MSQMPVVGLLADDARRAVARLEEEGDFQIRDLKEVGDLERLSKLFSDVWVTPDPIIKTELMRALSHAGNYVAGAFAEGEMLGGGVGFLGWEDGELILHSHILAVLPKAQCKNMGFALKQHQRLWSLTRGITRIRWTYDPLVRRNAYFNITKLGARAAAYYENFYGLLSDRVNAGDESDRVLINWELTSPRAVAASKRHHVDPAVDGLMGNGATKILDEADGMPDVRSASGDVLLCRVPTDIVALREADMRLALSWRKALRSTLRAALSDGYVVDEFSREGWYVLTRP